MRIKAIDRLPASLRAAILKSGKLPATKRHALLDAGTEAERAIRKARAAANRRKLSDMFAAQLAGASLQSLFTTEHHFSATRKWALDFYCPAWQLGVELHGMVSTRGGQGGRHTRGQGFINDRTKMNAAHIAGITVLEFTKHMLKDGTAIQQVKDFIAARAT